VRLALEVRRRVKEQQKRIGAAEFRNTHFSYTLGAEALKVCLDPGVAEQGASATNRSKQAKSGRSHPAGKKSIQVCSVSKSVKALAVGCTY